MKRALSFIGSGSHKSHYRAMYVYHKKYLAVDTGAHMNGLFFYKMKDGNLNVTVNEHDLKRKMLATITYLICDYKGDGTVNDRLLGIRYMRRVWPGAISIP